MRIVRGKKKIIKFLHRRLLIHGPVGSLELGGYLHTLPLILARDFNVNFAFDDAQPLKQFLHDKFKLQINSNPKATTTIYIPTMDEIFCRHLDNLHSNIYIPYFSFHRPISFVAFNPVLSNATNNKYNN